MTTLREAAQAALRGGGMSEPLFLLHTGQIDSGGEQDEWDCEADSGRRVDAFCRLHPGQTILLYPAEAIREAVEAEREAFRKALEECRDGLRLEQDRSCDQQADGVQRCIDIIDERDEDDQRSRARGAA